MGTDSSGLPLCEPGSRGRLGFLFQLLEVSAIFGLFVSQSFCVRPGLSRRKVFLCFFLIYCFLYFVHTQHKPVWSMPPCAAARGRGGGGPGCGVPSASCPRPPAAGRSGACI
jgi:hypothetical protein